MNTCKRCGLLITRTRKVRDALKYCSKTCAASSREFAARNCSVCSISFIPKSSTQSYCTKSCLETAKANRKALVPSFCKVFFGVCGFCERTFSGQREKPRRMCSQDYWNGHNLKLAAEKLRKQNNVPDTRLCAHCRATFRPTVAKHIYCIEQCLDRSLKRQRKHKLRTVAVEIVRLGILIERDSGRCQLCGTKVKLDAIVPHPKAPTIDHIIPISKGGIHSYSNTQLAHFQCNSQRSNIKPAQMRLVSSIESMGAGPSELALKV